MKHISLSVLLLAACSAPCDPKYTEAQVEEAANYWFTTCMNAEFTPSQCFEVAEATRLNKRLENILTVEACKKSK